MTHEYRIEGGIWKIEPASNIDEHELLEDWQCFELRLPSRLARTRHLVGCVGRWQEGRVSSAVVSFDLLLRLCTTESGRCYKLGKRTGVALNGEYVWDHWKSISCAEDVVDVTAEMKN